MNWILYFMKYLYIVNNDICFPLRCIIIGQKLWIEYYMFTFYVAIDLVIDTCEQISKFVFCIHENALSLKWVMFKMML